LLPLLFPGSQCAEPALTRLLVPRRHLARSIEQGAKGLHSLLRRTRLIYHDLLLNASLK
jgi:hypothetical protein